MIERVYQWIKQHKMIEAGSRILVGVSGGADSTCLLCVLRELAPRLGAQLEALHVHHGIRGAEADRDAAFVEQLCAEWGIPCHVERRDVPALAAAEHLSLEAAARQARYEALEWWRAQVGADRIAVAHHRGDQAETVLLHLFRGSGLEGLAGMQPVRGRVIRPFLDVSREEIEAFLMARGIACCEDSTNAENDAARNKLRNQIMPFLRQEINACVEDHILLAAKRAWEASDYLKRQAAAALSACRAAEAHPRHLVLDAARGVAQDPVILSYMLRLAVEECKGDTRDLAECHIRDMVSLFVQAEPRRFSLPGDLCAWRAGNRVVIGPKAATAAKKSDVPLFSLEMRTFSYDSSKKIPENRYTKWFDYDKIKYCLRVRHREEGDYLTIAPAGTKSLRRFFIDSKVPADERDTVTLVADGSHILWVVGYRISEAYKVTKETKTVLEIKAKEKRYEREN